jgi:hypothetical protein
VTDRLEREPFEDCPICGYRVVNGVCIRGHQS